MVQRDLATIAARQGRYADALVHAGHSLRLYQAAGHKAGQVGMLNNVGWFYSLLGDYRQARAFCEDALVLCAEIGDRPLEGLVWDSLGYAEHHLGNFGKATACYERALGMFRDSAERFYEAIILTHLGDNRRAVGDLAQAREAWQQALAILDDLPHPEAGQLRAKLASTNDHPAGDPPV